MASLFDDKNETYELVISSEFERELKTLKKKRPTIYTRLQKQILKILREPTLGKPLRNVLRNYRRVHIDSFVLIYEIHNKEIRLLECSHHDKIYKKQKP